MAGIDPTTKVDTKRKIGTTTVLSTAGAIGGIQVAQLVVEIFHWELSNDALMGLATLLVAGATLLGGFLSPSKANEVNAVVDKVTQNVPTYGDIQAMANSVAASAAGGAFTVQSQTVSTQPEIVKGGEYYGTNVEQTDASPIAYEDEERDVAAPVLENPEFSQ